MRISGSIPINVARAYGIAPTKAAQPATPAQPVQQARPVDQVDSNRPSENVQRLIAGQAPGPVDFASASTPTSHAGAYQLYNRAADRIEAATGVNLGRSIDLKG